MRNLLRRLLVVALVGIFSTMSANAQVPRLASDTSVKVTPEMFARAKAQVADASDLQTLWRLTSTIQQGSTVTQEAKDKANKLIAEAEKLGTAGSNGQTYRVLMQGLSLLTDAPWTAKEEFKAAVVLTVPTLVADQANPLLVTLTQRFAAEYPATPANFFS